MPSSTSSSDRLHVPVRDVPDRRWGWMLAGAFALFLALTTGWELYWRAFGAVPAYRNSDAEWAQQRRRIDQGEGGKTVLTGASRVLFDVNLDVWEQITGERPIQLALEGTSPMPVLEDLADDPNFTGRVLVGVAPDVFFSGFAYRKGAIEYFKKEGPSGRVGNWLSRHLVEPYFAFYDEDFALATVLRRQDWPSREGKHVGLRVRKLLIQPGADRNSEMCDKVATDPEYRALCRKVWAQDFDDVPPADVLANMVDKEVERATDAVAKLRARGVKVVFLRPPSVDDYYKYEQKIFPRAKTWDVLLAKTGAPGIHFEDYKQLQGYELPEWSHMSAPEARRFTAQLVPILVPLFR